MGGSVLRCQVPGAYQFDLGAKEKKHTHTLTLTLSQRHKENRRSERLPSHVSPGNQLRCGTWAQTGSVKRSSALRRQTPRGPSSCFFPILSLLKLPKVLLSCVFCAILPCLQEKFLQMLILYAFTLFSYVGLVVFCMNFSA